jgi:hypothetical protein
MSDLQSRAQILIGTFIDAPGPTQLRVRESHLCVISPKGRILHLASCDSSKSDREVLHDLDEGWKAYPVTRLPKSQFIVPGLVDCHVQ